MKSVSQWVAYYVAICIKLLTYIPLDHFLTILWPIQDKMSLALVWGYLLALPGAIHVFAFLFGWLLRWSQYMIVSILNLRQYLDDVNT